MVSLETVAAYGAPHCTTAGAPRPSWTVVPSAWVPRYCCAREGSGGTAGTERPSPPEPPGSFPLEPLQEGCWERRSLLPHITLGPRPGSGALRDGICPRGQGGQQSSPEGGGGQAPWEQAPPHTPRVPWKWAEPQPGSERNTPDCQPQERCSTL